MNECPNQLQLEHTGLLSAIQTDIQNMKIVISDLGSIKDAIIEMKIMNKLQLQFNERQVQSNDKFEGTLINIDDNLTNLNDRVGRLENIKADSVQEKIEDQKNGIEIKKSKFALWASIVPGVLAFIGMILVAVIK